MSIISPTGGFIISFIFVAYFAGLIVDLNNKQSFPTYLSASIIGLLFNYGIGVSYMYLAMNTWLNLEITYLVAWYIMITFLIKDGGFAVLYYIFMIVLTNRV